MQSDSTNEFKEVVWQYYADAGRTLPWRQPDLDGTYDPYAIMVSEIMLQQTQVSGVIPKYQAFLSTFPDVQTLAAAPLASVLAAWSGLGYNRRAKYLWQAARTVATERNGFPDTIDGLKALPGIGANTAGAIMAYAYNQPVAYIETNIRTVYMHHFFAEQTGVADSAILALVVRTVDHDEPRQWYWALMDYGSHLKRTVGNISRDAKAYTKQSAFAGSLRQIRGNVLKALTMQPSSASELATIMPDGRLPEVLDALTREGLIVYQKGTYALPG